jgi:hypothetical protein
MLRMQLLTDYLRNVERAGLIDESVYLQVHEAGNGFINGGECGPPLAEPFAAVDQMLIDNFGVEKARLKSVFEIALANSSVLSYPQLGRPETISITSIDNADEFHAFWEAEAERENLPNQEPKSGAGGGT